MKGFSPWRSGSAWELPSRSSATCCTGSAHDGARHIEAHQTRLTIMLPALVISTRTRATSTPALTMALTALVTSCCRNVEGARDMSGSPLIGHCRPSGYDGKLPRAGNNGREKAREPGPRRLRHFDRRARRVGKDRQTIRLWIRILRIARPISSFSANC
jgi:hypothetical protein